MHPAMIQFQQSLSSNNIIDHAHACSHYTDNVNRNKNNTKFDLYKM
jgi:hypothetical protein